VIPGIALVALVAGAIVAKETPTDAPTKVKKMDSMDMSKILFLFQSAYVLRMKKNSEKTTDTIPIPESISSNTWHLLELSFGLKLRYRFEVRRTKGRYRVTIYRPFTLLHCDLSKNDHSSSSEQP
jgi:hypothetical protein